MEQQQQQKKINGGEITSENNDELVDYMIHNSTVHDINDEEDDHRPYHHHVSSSSFCNSTSSLDKLNFQDVMQFADFGPKLSVNQLQQQPKINLPPADEETAGIDPIYFLKFPVLNHHQQQENDEQSDMMFGSTGGRGRRDEINVDEEDENENENENVREVRLVGENKENNNKNNEMMIIRELEQVKIINNNKKKRGRSIKTSEEVESQRMTHIAVERNRRKQMNEHLRVLRSLMPASYVQRGDQASIIGGAIEFVRELEQLLQCLESQKRRRLYGDGVGTTPIGPSSAILADQDPHLPFFPAIPPPHDGQLQETGIGGEEIAESKSCIADIEVKLLGFDAMIKILSRRRPGQLVKAIAALEDLQINILHTNITTIDQTVLYSFTVKVGGEARFTAEDIANSVQQIFTFIHAYDSI